jgi:hypothetical protein
MDKKYKIFLLTWLVFSMAHDQYKQRQALKAVLEGMNDHQEILKALQSNNDLVSKKNMQMVVDEFEKLWNKGVTGGK